MKKTFLVITLLISIASAQSNFQNFIQRLNSTSSDSIKNRMIDSFLISAQAQGIPYIEDTLANFIYRGSGTNVYLSGDFNGWSSSADKLNRISGTNFFYITKIFERDARLDYKFIVDGNWILDPLNPKTCPGGFGPNSELAMPDYIQPVEIKYYPNIPHGTLRDTTFYSTNLNNSRTIRVYLPPNYESSTDSFPMILMHDGLEYISLASMHNVLDYLIAQNQIEPIIGVFVPPVNRTPEYAGNQIQAFSNFIVNELLPYIRNRYRVKSGPQNCAVGGASNGGNISLYLALNYPNVFGNVAAQSSNVISSISQGFQNNPKLNLKVYLDIGKYDISVLIPLVRNLRSILQSKGYEMIYREYNEGHSWGNWRAHIDDYLKFFFPKKTTDVKDLKGNVVPNKFKLYQNFPNPFNNQSKIRFDVAHPGIVQLKIFDTLGRELKNLVKEIETPGEYEINFDANNLAGGVYYYQMSFRSEGLNSKGSFNETKKMIVLK
ncbi:MAG: alpha/beta hydrolase-fold protein [Ignavibacteria bacterium]|nr:alpha/beta hydrolase-fold protein [Ignavibacteria bacterium]